jgi:hypothetical protein
VEIIYIAIGLKLLENLHSTKLSVCTFISILKGTRDRLHIGLDAFGPIFDIANFLEGTAEVLNQLQPLMGLFCKVGGVVVKMFGLRV